MRILKFQDLRERSTCHCYGHEWTTWHIGEMDGKFFYQCIQCGRMRKSRTPAPHPISRI